jgi:alginate O-acetyltransferase complex protein AlgI
MYFNLVLVFFLCGLWHGASWTFVVWGLYHGVFLVLERVGLAALVGRLPQPLRHAYALLVVMVGWVIFRADTLSGALVMLAAMAGASAATPSVFAPAWFWNAEVALAVCLGIVGSTPVLTAVGQRLAVPAENAGVRVLRWQASMAAIVGLVAMLGASLMLSASRSYNPFIYFRF